MLNSYLVFILVCIVSVFFLDTIADVLNLRCLDKVLPSEFVGIYDPKKYAHSLEYQAEGTHFELFRRTLFFLVTVSFILLGGFNMIDTWVRKFGWNEVQTGLAFVGSLLFLRFLISLPFSIYDTFVIEEKHGFNKTTPKTFITDLVKGTLLGSLLGGIIFSGIVYFFESAGNNAWIYCWMGLTLFQILLMYLAPAVIMPLFNQFKPLPDGPLKSAIEAYSHSQNFHLSGIFTMDSSKRSTKSNAFFTGFGRFRRLVLFDTLVEKHSIEELVAILAHEIGHFKRKHIIKSLILSIVTTGVIFFVISLFMKNPELFAAFQMERISVYASLVFVGFLYGPILRILSIFTQKLSRVHEFEADDYSVKTYGKPEVLISALKKLSVGNLSHLTPARLKVVLEYSHPPILQRICALRRKIN